LLTPEFAEKLQTGDRYEVSVAENAIILKKIETPLVDLDRFFEHLDKMPPDPQKLSLEEISDLVKEVRQHKRNQNESRS
jgi:hypothetical protein